MCCVLWPSVRHISGVPVWISFSPNLTLGTLAKTSLGLVSVFRSPCISDWTPPPLPTPSNPNPTLETRTQIVKNLLFCNFFNQTCQRLCLRVSVSMPISPRGLKPEPLTLLGQWMRLYLADIARLFPQGLPGGSRTTHLISPPTAGHLFCFT